MASKKKRICCVCRTLKPAENLIRVARIDGKYTIDAKGNANGRGCHICPGCVDKAIKTKAINKSFKTNVGNEIYDLLRVTDDLNHTK